MRIAAVLKITRPARRAARAGTPAAGRAARTCFLRAAGPTGSIVVGTGPRFSRPMSARAISAPLDRRLVRQRGHDQARAERLHQISRPGTSTTLTNGNRYSWLASGWSASSQWITVGSRYVPPSNSHQPLAARETAPSLLGPALRQPALDRRVDSLGHLRHRETPPAGPSDRRRAAGARSAPAARPAPRPAPRPCATSRTLEALMHDRPPLAATDVTISSR